MAAIVRRTLLGAAAGRAPASVGADLRFCHRGRRSTDLARLRPRGRRRRHGLADPRAARADAFGPTVETATAKFIWFGTDYLFDGLTFVHERGPHGVFAVHGYPISADVSHVHRRDRRGVLAGGRARRVRRHPAARAERREDQGVPGGAVRRADRRRTSCWSTTRGGATSAPAAPRRWHDPRAAAGRAARRRRAHRALLGRAPAPRWRWRTRSRWPRRSTAHPGDLPAALAAYEAAARPSVRGDPGLGAAQPVLVGALRALPRRVRAVAVRLPLPVPQHHRRPAGPPRPRRSSPPRHRAWRGSGTGRAAGHPAARCGGTALPGPCCSPTSRPGAAASRRPRDEAGLPRRPRRVREAVAATGAELVAVHGGAAFDPHARLRGGPPASQRPRAAGRRRGRRHPTLLPSGRLRRTARAAGRRRPRGAATAR